MSIYSADRSDEAQILRKRTSKLQDKQRNELSLKGSNQSEIELQENKSCMPPEEDKNTHNMGKSKAQSSFLSPHNPTDDRILSTVGSDSRFNRKKLKSDSNRDKNSESSKNKNSGSDKQKSTDNSSSKQSIDEFEEKRKLEDTENEKTHYYLTNIFIQGSTLHGFFWVNSYINPRHVRGTIWFTYTILIWYIWAVAYNNMREPDEVPDFERQTSDLTWGEIWIAYAAPFGATILLYIFTIIMKLSPNRIRATRTTKFLDYVITEYGREQVIRYLMGYLILAAVNVMIFVYIITFTARHGWKISWRWWYTGTLSFWINYWIYDPIAAVAHWAIYK
jgi:hypothetical protein